MKIQGVIEAKSNEEGTSKTTGLPYTRYLFTINGQSYSTFDSVIYEKFKVGQIVEMDGEQKGQFYNMKTMTELGEMPIELVKLGDKVAEKPSNGATKVYPKDPVGLAIEIYCAKDITMADAVALTKAAKEAFE